MQGGADVVRARRDAGVQRRISRVWNSVVDAQGEGPVGNTLRWWRHKCDLVVAYERSKRWRRLHVVVCGALIWRN